MPVSERECDQRHEALNDWIKGIQLQVGKLEGKIWWILALLLSNLAGVIVLLVTNADKAHR
jgi:hypothetical protein